MWAQQQNNLAHYFILTWQWDSSIMLIVNQSIRSRIMAHSNLNTRATQEDYSKVPAITSTKFRYLGSKFWYVPFIADNNRPPLQTTWNAKSIMHPFFYLWTNDSVISIERFPNIWIEENYCQCLHSGLPEKLFWSALIMTIKWYQTSPNQTTFLRITSFSTAIYY